MQPLDAVYLQILKNLCTDLSEPVPLDGVDPSALYRLAEKHCSLPFLPDGIRTGRYLHGQRLKELAAQPEVGEFQGGVLVIHPVHGVGRLAGLGAEQGTDLCLPCPHGLCGFQRPPAADDAQAHAALIVFSGQGFYSVSPFVR